MNQIPLFRILLSYIFLGVIGAGGQGLQAKESPAAPMKLTVDSGPIDRSTFDRVSYSAVVKKAAPSVVDVLSTKRVRAQEMSQFFNDPMFRHFFGMPDQQQGEQGGRPREQRTQNLGSGIIVTANGYILTNNHVVEGADEVKVKFGEPQREFTATIIGRDAETDVAVLKIDAKDLPIAVLGDSDELQVGDTVLAIGDPFGIGPTVTHGIVSALGRDMNREIENIEDFIQTDAAINPGNSGGALLDSDGRVVGINTAILSHSGGSNGVGFAIPINLVRSVAEQLVATGKVQRGFLGVDLEELTPDLAAQFGTASGALVTDVTAGGPADKAGLKSGDIITKLNGKTVANRNHLVLAVISLPPGKAVTVEYIRNGQTATVSVKLGARPPKGQGPGEDHGAQGDEGVLNGVGVTDITSEAREQLQLPADVKGALVTEVDPESGSAQAGITQGDIILELNRKPVHNADEAVRLSAEIKGPKVLVRIWRKGASWYVVVDETKKPSGESSPPEQEQAP